jgi:polyisoprenoid-binding protein YceI
MQRAWCLPTLLFSCATAWGQPSGSESLFQNGHMGGNCAQCHETSTLPRYEFDRAQSKILYSVKAYGFEAVGLFRSIAGGFVFDPSAPEKGSVIATVDVASVDSGDTALDSLIRSERFLGAKEHPVISFRSTSVETVAAGRLRVSGVLSLAGRERALTLDVETVAAALDPVTGRHTAGFVARGTLARSDFGLSLGLPAIAEQVQFTIYAAGNLLD